MLSHGQGRPDISKALFELNSNKEIPFNAYIYGNWYILYIILYIYLLIDTDGKYTRNSGRVEPQYMWYDKNKQGGGVPKKSQKNVSSTHLRNTTKFLHITLSVLCCYKWTIHMFRQPHGDIPCQFTLPTKCRNHHLLFLQLILRTLAW